MTDFFKRLDPHALQLNPHRVDIWEYSLSHMNPALMTCLSKAEQDRANRFHFEKHRRRFMIAHAILRHILAHYVNQSPASLEFTENAYGKPRLLNEYDLQFNLSHSRNLALLAVGTRAPVGVDVEFFAAREYLGIAKQMFSPQEYQAFSQLDNHLKPLSFYHIWAQKEALIKACGLGLFYPTQHFCVPILPSTQHSIFDALHQKTWNIFSWMPNHQSSAAICYEPHIQDIYYGQASDFIE